VYPHDIREDYATVSTEGTFVELGLVLQEVLVRSYLRCSNLTPSENTI
jgi:hypothetical protein